MVVVEVAAELGWLVDCGEPELAGVGGGEQDDGGLDVVYAEASVQGVEGCGGQGRDESAAAGAQGAFEVGGGGPGPGGGGGGGWRARAGTGRPPGGTGPYPYGGCVTPPYPLVSVIADSR